MREHKTKRGKYKDWLEPEKLTLIEGWARSGLSNEQIADNMGINEATLYTWIKKHDQINKAIKKGGVEKHTLPIKTLYIGPLNVYVLFSIILKLVARVFALFYSEIFGDFLSPSLRNY